MKKLLVLACMALPLVGCAAGSVGTEPTADESDEMNVLSRDVLIDFDQVGGAAVPNNSVVDATYSASGVTFSCVACSSNHAYARALGNGTQGVSLVDPQASILPFFDARSGAVTATFDTPRSWVSIDAVPVLPPEYVGTPTNVPWIEAYDANGNLLAKTLYPIAYGQPGYGSEQTLTVSSSPAAIKLVRFSSRHDSGPAVYGTFDNLRYNGSLILIPIPLPRPLIPLH